MFGTASYTYSILDNLSTVKVTAGSQVRDHTCVYDAQNRLTNVTNTVGGATVIGLGYDVRGNLANRSGQLYQFDFGNRLRSAPGSETYRYDAHGRRVAAHNGTGIYSVYSQSGQLLFQRDDRTSKRLQHVYLGSSQIATRERPTGSDTETITYQHTDALGSPIAATNPAKVKVQTSEYEPYGKLLNRANDNRPGYTGHVMDTTGLTYMQQRYYDPQIGLFLSVDPVTAYSNPVGQFHRYRYANNNPYKFVDSDGRFSDDPDRAHRGGLNVTYPSPEADRIEYQNGGAPTRTITAMWKKMSSGNDSDRLAVARMAMAVERINGNPKDLAYNPALAKRGSATTDPSGLVELGPDAFFSWSWLSATLGHEFEVHVPQFQSFGPYKDDQESDSRELEAHKYNVDNAGRFRNSRLEVERFNTLRDGYQRRVEEGHKRNEK